MQKSNAASVSRALPRTASDRAVAPSHRKLSDRVHSLCFRVERISSVAQCVSCRGTLGISDSEIKTWLQLEVEKFCDILVLQETQWQESTEFTVSGWYCVSSASKKTVNSRQAGAIGKTSVDSDGKAPSTTAADGLMVLFSPRFNKAQIRWKEWITGQVLDVRDYWAGARKAILAVYQHVWSSYKTQQDNRGDRSAVLSALTKAMQQVPKRDTLIVAGDFNSSLTTT